MWIDRIEGRYLMEKNRLHRTKGQIILSICIRCLCEYGERGMHVIYWENPNHYSLFFGSVYRTSVHSTFYHLAVFVVVAVFFSHVVQIHVDFIVYPGFYMHESNDNSFVNICVYLLRTEQLPKIPRNNRLANSLSLSLSRCSRNSLAKSHIFVPTIGRMETTHMQNRITKERACAR